MLELISWDISYHHFHLSLYKNQIIFGGRFVTAPPYPDLWRLLLAWSVSSLILSELFLFLRLLFKFSLGCHVCEDWWTTLPGSFLLNHRCEQLVIRYRTGDFALLRSTDPYLKGPFHSFSLHHPPPNGGSFLYAWSWL